MSHRDQCLGFRMQFSCDSVDCPCHRLGRMLLTFSRSLLLLYASRLLEIDKVASQNSRICTQILFKSCPQNVFLPKIIGSLQEENLVSPLCQYYWQ